MQDTDEVGGGAGGGEFAYRKTIEVAGVPGRMREFPFGATGRFGVVTTGGVGNHAALANQMQCSVLTVGIDSFAKFKPTAEEFWEALFATVPLAAEAQEIAVLGPSGGGYVALGIGIALSRMKPNMPVRVVAFNPPTKIWPFEQARMKYAPYRDLMTAGQTNPVMRRALEERGDIAKLLANLWKDHPNADFRAFLLGSAYHDRDAWHIGRLVGMPNIHTLMLETDAHGVHRMMTMPIENIEVQTKLAKNLYKLAPEGMQTGQVGSAATAEATRVTRELRARFPSVRAMFDWLDEQPAGDTSRAAAAFAAAG